MLVDRKGSNVCEEENMCLFCGSKEQANNVEVAPKRGLPSSMPTCRRQLFRNTTLCKYFNILSNEYLAKYYHAAIAGMDSGGSASPKRTLLMPNPGPNANSRSNLVFPA